MSARPGRRASSAPSSSSEHLRVLAPGNFSTTRIRHLAPSAHDGVADQRLVVLDDVGDVTELGAALAPQHAAVGALHRDLGELGGGGDGLLVEDVRGAGWRCR